MKFTPTPIEGVVIVDLEPVRDERGFFTRSFCAREFAAAGLHTEFVQTNIAFSHRAGTLRGMHWQVAPHEEVKLVRCTRGAIFEVALDLRPQSATFCQWFSIELSADNGRALYLPKGCANGYQTLLPDTEVHYAVSAPYTPESARGARWDDPAFGIVWPDTAQRTISARDAAVAHFNMSDYV